MNIKKIYIDTIIIIIYDSLLYYFFNNKLLSVLLDNIDIYVTIFLFISSNTIYYIDNKQTIHLYIKYLCNKINDLRKKIMSLLVRFNKIV